ncbi:MAG: bifunctional 4-hydroxy-2-oxoglutarate aldolase/2-dehydro-3-deoxy-phosphogluconate aldolase [Halieaceae bacterium]|nr:bifunctional 4-hydroxy-2-oxoglutarate aldolase/2-dehydro-3-deoxy-phosphogluconate aldolase [Halieaceae bacterium]
MSINYDFIMAAPVVPVLVIDDLESAIPMAEALVAGGLPALEITLRTGCALDAIERIAKAVPNAFVGAGTVCNGDQLRACKDRGAQFIVSPGSSQSIFNAAKETALPLLPGVSSASEMIAAMDAGYDILKFFPAEANGGAKALKAYSGPFPHVRFCPTGGINPANLKDYLSLPSVVAVGGSWLTPKQAVQSKNWDAIRQLAAEAVVLANDIVAAA